MSLSREIEAVYRRALQLRQYALSTSTPHDLLDHALKELYFVLEELQTTQEELERQNQTLSATREVVERERQRYRALFELAPNGYVLTDRQGIIVEVNHHASALLFRCPTELLLQKPLVNFIAPCDRAYLQRQLAQPKPRDPWEVTLQPRDGELLPVAIAVTQIRDPQDRQIRCLWSLQAMPEPLSPPRSLQSLAN